MQSHVPNVIFKTRVRNDALGGPNPFDWKDLSTGEIFNGQKVVLFALPGAFTPTCSSSHLPRYEELFAEFQAQGVDKIVCLSVNDAFVMYQWGQAQGANNVFLLPDGNGEFSRKMGMLVDKSDLACAAGAIRCLSMTAKSRKCSRNPTMRITARSTRMRYRMPIPCWPGSRAMRWKKPRSRQFPMVQKLPAFSCSGDDFSKQP